MSPAIPISELLERAIAHHKAARFGKAEKAYDAILLRDPGHADANNLVGLIALEFGYHDEAIEHASRAIERVPDSSMFHCNLANALVAAGRHDEAVVSYRRAIELDPSSLAATYSLGLLYLHREEFGSAADCFARALQIAPTHASARHLWLALTGSERPDTAPAEYVAETFDSYAHGFEAHLRETLRYEVPEILRRLFDEIAEPPAEPAWTVLDLGCGTGLCGDAFRDLAARLLGCDLSNNMLAQAAERGIYHELWHEDLVSTLGRFDADADVILAADVFIYLGALGPCLQAAARALRPGGWLAFSVEDADEDFALRPTGRYAHAGTYVRAHADAAGLSIARSEPIAVRIEGGAPVPGHVFVLTRGISG